MAYNKEKFHDFLEKITRMVEEVSILDHVKLNFVFQ